MILLLAFQLLVFILCNVLLRAMRNSKDYVHDPCPLKIGIFVVELRHLNNNSSNENVIIRYFGIIFCFSFAINTKDTDVMVSVFKDHIEQGKKRERDFI